MSTGDILTHEQASYDVYHPSNASWNEQPATNSGCPTIGTLPEEDEEDRAGYITSHRTVALGGDEGLSASPSSQSNFSSAGPFTRSSLPHTIPTSSSSHSKSLSASPAAMFLSSFHSPIVSTPKPDDEGQVISGYTLGGIIGTGGSSIIRRATSSSGAISAVKIVRRSDLVKAGNAPQARKRLHHEATVWASLSHEHILPLFSSVHTTYADYFFTLYCPAGSLFDILKRDGNPALPQDDVGMMFRQVVRGLRYLHEVACYVHRDIKPENVLVDEMGVCKISDFGMSRKIGSLDESDEDEEDQQDFETFSGSNSLHRAVSLATPSTRRYTNAFPLVHSLHRHNTTRHRNSTSSSEPKHIFQPGSLPYAAPELFLTQTSEVLRPHPGQDIWALGVMLYTLLTGFLPFSDSFEPRLQMKILKGTYEVPHGIGRGAERILQGCLERSVANRWTIVMVDDIAWGVGWGSEGDDATPSDPPEDTINRNHWTESRSRSSSRQGTFMVPEESDRHRDENLVRPSLITASRRSTSRVKRSLSRAPVLTDRSTSARSVSRSVSRRPQGSPPYSADSFIPDVASSSSLLSLGLYDSMVNDSALADSPTSSSPVERGRRQNKPNYLHSRSPSPSILPTTPKDEVSESDDLLEQPDELHLDPESSRGRSGLCSAKIHDTGAPGGPNFDPETDDWHAHDIERDFNATHPSSRSDAGVEVLVRQSDRTINMEIGWRQRPTSSPPTAPRSPVESSSHGAPESFLNSSAISSNSNLVYRSRSEENARRQV